jgi:hypothetical protein
MSRGRSISRIAAGDYLIHHPERFGALCEARMNTRRRPSKVLVTKFLRDALAADALGVRRLEARAREAGLLNERQRITHAKPLWRHPLRSAPEGRSAVKPGPNALIKL